MKKILLFLLLFAGMANAQIVNIPDANFKAKLLAADVSNNTAQDFNGYCKIDSNNDGNIQVSEAATITYLDVQNAGIADLTGISSFTSLQMLFCGHNQLTTLDATGLDSLIVLIADNNQLSSINVTNLFNLEMLDCTSNQFTSVALNGQGLASLRGVNFGNNQLTSINVSGISTLETYTCPNNLLTSVSVSGLPNLRFLDCSGNQLTTLAINSLLSMEILYCYDNDLTSLTFTGLLASFHTLICSQNQLTSLNVSNLPNLDLLHCGNNLLTAINTSGLTSLTDFDCSQNNFTSLNINGLTSLKFFSADYNQFPSLTISGLNNLQSISCHHNLLTTMNLSALPALTQILCYNNLFTTLDFTNLPSLELIMTNYNQLTSLTVSGMPNLKKIFCGQNLLASLNLSNLNNLELLWADDNELTSLDVSALPNLQQLTCAHNHIPQLDVNGLSNLTYLWCPYNELPTLQVNNLTNLQALGCSNNLLSALDVGGLINLTQLECQANSIPALNVNGMVNLIYLMAGANQLTSIDLTGLTSLKQLDVSFNQLTTLDASDCHNLTLGITAHNNQLQTLFVKNGINESITFSNNPNLLFICADEAQVGDLQLVAESSNLENTVVSSYCSFTPGGDYNSITGTVHFDENANGCDATDVTGYNVRFDLTGPVASGTFANAIGEYTLYAEDGDYTLNAHLENPAYFNLAPTTANFNFPAIDNSVQIQDFCLTANGAHPDLEIVLVPFGNARPGFDAMYQLVYKNKGNQTLSGTVNLVFDDAHTDFVTATPTVNTQSINSLIWNYTDLHPFESRVILLTLNVNSPLEEPAVEAGDFLDFTASINFASGDETPADNVSMLHQMATNSLDPNVKTCLEGTVVSPQEIGNYLHYNIEFENLGSAEAVNVVVKDIIDTNMFDINSLQILYSSHDMRATVRENVVEFVFENINLDPATGNPPVGGHGNVLFKIKTLPTLVTGDEVTNSASIHFDYNAAIDTNLARTAFTTLSNPGFNPDESLILYPNPAHNVINITCDNNINLVTLYDIQGRILQTDIGHSNSMAFDLSNQSNGVYFLKITTDKGQKVEKFVKQ